jgi:NAD(P)-dependent dehydrogenase (short-subunit alcohol dehydrogenase family)
VSELRPNLYDFSSRVALVTGGASGIGFATVSRLARCGASVAVVDRDSESLEQAAKDLNALSAKIETYVCDVSRPSDVDAAVQQTEQTLGPIDMLVNNAGVWIIKAYVEHDDDDLDRQLSVNLRGADMFMRRVLPGMIERGRGSIVNTSSVAALHFTVPHAGYAASKAAVIALTRDVAFEVGRSGIRVNCVAPGLIAADRRPGGTGHYFQSKNAASGRGLDDRTENHPLGWGRPDDVASLTAFLLSDEARFITGVTIPIVGGSDLQITMAKTD